MSALICRVCNQDHKNMNRKWCDRSDLEIKYDDLQSRLDMAVECLKFYANEDSWRFSSDLNGHEYYEEINLDDVESTSLAMSYGGKKAREVLKQINPKED